MPAAHRIDYREMARIAITPFLTERMDKTKTIADWAEWLERQGVTEQVHADNLVKIAIQANIEGICGIR